MIAYIWTRESNLYDKERYSIKSQLDACREAAKADGVEVAREFSVQFSGRDLWAIPELTELRELIQRTEGPKRIYCYSQDRLVRGEEAFDIFYLIVEFRRYGAEVKALKSPLDMKNIAGQIMTLIAGHEAAGEIEKIRDRTQRGKKRRVQEGKLWGLGRDKFGYRKDKERGTAEIHEVEAETIKRIFREVCEGKSLMTVAKDLNRDGIPTSFTSRGERKAQWHPATVRVLLLDPAYKGEVWAYRHGGEPYRMPDGLFPAIVDAANWQRAQERLEINRGEKARNKRRPALLRGLIFCATCGARMYFVSQSAIDRFYYRCSSDSATRHEVKNKRCGGSSVRADWIEAVVWGKVVRSLQDPDQLIATLDLSRTVGIAEQLQSRLDVIRRQIAQKGDEQERLARRLRAAAGRVASLIEAEIEQIETERQRLQIEEAEVSAELHEQGSAMVSVEHIRGICSQLTPTMRDEASFDEKREALDTLRIVVIANGRDWELQTFAFLCSSKSVINKTYTVLAKSDRDKS